jgi:hypothetical protein
MTLLTTELHPREDGTIVVFAADRRISRGDVPSSDQQKIFRMPHLAAGIGFFGLAEVPDNVGMRTMSDWVQDFLYTIRAHDELSTIAARLADGLNRIVPADWHATERSGFHMAGFNAAGRPEFWFVRNVDDDGEPTLGRYEPREDFQGRDHVHLSPAAVQVYRNGDIRAHVTAWEKIDEAYGSLLGAPDFMPIATPLDYCNWVRFKMSSIVDFYERFCVRSIIGRPIDAFAFSSTEFFGV